MRRRIAPLIVILFLFWSLLLSRGISKPAGTETAQPSASSALLPASHPIKPGQGSIMPAEQINGKELPKENPFLEGASEPVEDEAMPWCRKNAGRAPTRAAPARSAPA